MAFNGFYSFYEPRAISRLRTMHPNNMRRQDNVFDQRTQETPCTTIQSPRATDRTSHAKYGAGEKVGPRKNEKQNTEEGRGAHT